MHRRNVSTVISQCVSTSCRRSELRNFSSTFVTSDTRKTTRDEMFSQHHAKMTFEQRRMVKDIFKLVNKATQKDPGPGWSGIKKRRLEETKLRTDVGVVESGSEAKERNLRKSLMKLERTKLGPERAANRSVLLPSPTKEAYDADAGGEVEDLQDVETITFEPGMFVEMRRNQVSLHGVILNEKSSDGRLLYTCLMSTGEIWAPSPFDLFFSLPPIAPKSLLQRCGSDPIVTETSEQNARVLLLKRMRIIERALENRYHAVSAAAHGLYEKLRHPDPNKWAQVTVEELTSALKMKGLLSQFAVHKFLMNNPINYIADPGYRASHAFQVAPAAQVNDLKQVEEWMRIKQGGPLIKFAQKARGIIIANRSKLKLKYADAPSWRPAQHEWDESDQTILRVLMNALRLQRSNQSDPYVIPISTILKGLDLESPVLKNHELQMALVELGVLAPWKDLVAIQPYLGVDLEQELEPQWEKEQNELVRRGFEAIEQKAVKWHAPQTQVILGPEDFHPSDPLEEIRHDFGNMKVYIVDDSSAKELDDGISIERIPLEPGNMWIHVHITDVASMIPPGHVLAVNARKKQWTIYLNNHTFSLFPSLLAYSPTHGLSLGSGGQDGRPLRVLTFSCKIDADANMLDYKIRAGLVRNIRIIDYDSVDRALGLPSRSRYPFGRSSSTNDRGTLSLSEEETHDFRDLLGFVNAATLQRLKCSSPIVDNIRGVVQLGSLPQGMPTRPTCQPTEFSGFPSMDYVVQRSSDMDSGSRAIIAEAAKMACRAISRFGLEKDLPLLHRYCPPFIPNNPKDFHLLMKSRTANGYVDAHTLAKCVSSSQQSGYSLLPKAHSVLGIPEGEGYVKGTSPLRRYSDLVVHWQLHHALLGERAKSNKPPFSADDLEKHRSELMACEGRYKILQTYHEKYWQTMYIHRWMEGIKLGHIDPSKNPMDVLQGRILRRPTFNLERRYQAPILIPAIGVRSTLLLPDHTTEADIGMVFDVKLGSVELGTKPNLWFKLKK